MVRAAAADATIGQRVVARMLGTLQTINAAAAREIIRIELSKLEERDYCHSVRMPYADGDVYGISAHGYGWYVKFHMTADMLAVVSFHEPDEDLERADKTWIRTSR